MIGLLIPVGPDELTDGGDAIGCLPGPLQSAAVQRTHANEAQPVPRLTAGARPTSVSPGSLGTRSLSPCWARRISGIAESCQRGDCCHPPPANAAGKR